MSGQQSEELSHDLVLSITRILDLKAPPETDPLDTVGDGFDIIDVVNEYFPDGAFALVEATTKLSTLYVILYLEQSLGKLDAIQAQLAQDEQDLWDEIVRLQEELRGQQESGKVQLIQEMISVCLGAYIILQIATERIFVCQDLLSQMSLIREKATESEAIVRDITKDIQVLDLAKENLVLSMTTLKRLQMLGALPPSSHRNAQGPSPHSQ